MYTVGQTVTVAKTNRGVVKNIRLYLGKSGVVSHIETDGGCEPLYYVEFPDGVVKQYWDEELEN